MGQSMCWDSQFLALGRKFSGCFPWINKVWNTFNPSVPKLCYLLTSASDNCIFCKDDSHSCTYLLTLSSLAMNCDTNYFCLNVYILTNHTIARNLCFFFSFWSWVSGCGMFQLWVAVVRKSSANSQILFTCFLAFLSLNPGVHPMLGETVACAAVSPHLYKLSCVKVQRCYNPPLQQLHSYFRDFDNGVCHLTKISIAENNLGMGLF